MSADLLSLQTFITASVLSVVCPQCGAKEKEFCSDSGGQLEISHRERRLKAIEALGQKIGPKPASWESERRRA